MSTAIKKVLFVSPHESLKQAFTSFDACRDWEMDLSPNSFNALQLVKNSCYDLIIMDHGIEPLNPFKLMDYVFQELNKECPMIIVGDGSEAEGVFESYLRFNYPIEQYNIDSLFSNITVKKVEKEDQLFSLDYLNELSDNNEEFLEESIQLFRDSLAVKFEDLKKAISRFDFQETRQIAHNVKPTFAMLGNEKGRAMCHAICYDASDSEIPELCLVLKNEYNLIINEIEKQFPKLKVL